VKIFEAKRFLVVCGGPHEDVDGVRHYQNKGRDTGHGTRVAAALMELGAQVTLISANAPSLPVMPGLEIIEKVHGRKIISTQDLIAACVQQAAEDYDAVVQLANIPGFIPAQRSGQKLKVKNQSEEIVSLDVIGNADVMAQVRSLFFRSAVIGYDNRQQWVCVDDSELSRRIRVVADQHRYERSHRPSERHWSAVGQELKGLRVIVTSGPTVEAITEGGDAISNFSSGRQGHAVAEALACMGADVVLVSGPTHLVAPDWQGIHTVNVGSAQEMYDAVISELPADIFVGVAAVADFGLQVPVALSLAEGETHTLRLKQNPDILQAVGTHHSLRPSVVVGFAAETHDLLEYALGKLERKGADIICANQVGDEMVERSSSMNSITFVTRSGHEELPEISKLKVGEAIGQKIAQLLAQKSVRHE
jgi:phosphopantothenoylcysteine synthetase/decarboxylase